MCVAIYIPTKLHFTPSVLEGFLVTDAGFRQQPDGGYKPHESPRAINRMGDVLTTSCSDVVIRRVEQMKSFNRTFNRTVVGAFAGGLAGALMAASTMFVMDVLTPKPANANELSYSRIDDNTLQDRDENLYDCNAIGSCHSRW